MLPWILAASGLLVAACIVYVQVVKPIRGIRRVLRHLADESREPSDTPGFDPGWLFAGWAPDLRLLESRLGDMQRQITDESFNLRAILSSMVEGVLIVDASHRIRLANEALHKLFNLTQSPMNRSIMEVFRNHDLLNTVRAALDSGQPQSQELTLDAYQDGNYLAKHFEVTAVSLMTKGSHQPIGAIAVFHDISKIKELEAVRREFVANVSHELRTPLSIINGYVETLLDGALEDRETSERFLKVMAKHGERLNLLIEDLLTLSKLESRTASMHFEQVDVRACVQRVLEQLDPNLAQKKAVAHVDIPGDCGFIEADERRLEQLLFNLLDNSIKYGPADSLRIQVRARRDGGTVDLFVEDNGPGIPLEDQPHIFERFYRVHKDRSRDAGGTGLGLSIVKHIVQAHGGSVGVRSMPGLGATFHLRLPVEQAS